MTFPTTGTVFRPLFVGFLMLVFAGANEHDVSDNRHWKPILDVGFVMLICRRQNLDDVFDN